MHFQNNNISVEEYILIKQDNQLYMYADLSNVDIKKNFKKRLQYIILKIYIYLFLPSII